MKTLINKLNDLFMKDAYFLDEKGNLLKEKIKTSAISMDDHLLSILMSDDDVKNAFFVKKNDTLIFDKVKFSWVVSNTDFLPNSYTSYKNKIGLIDSTGDFLKSKDDVVLSFPYKDAVLLGGQTKDDEKRSECMLNETLCKDYIDNLLAPKAFKFHYKFDGQERHDVHCNMEDNYIIKGNNLIALHSLLPNYEGKVKLIFIDPPYNTNNDTFGYQAFFLDFYSLFKAFLSKIGIIYPGFH